jgi:outer membrane protein OmpA-like peptidoglycan-associated protein
MRWWISLIVGLFVLAAAPASARQDAEGCKDHPLFSRFPNMRLAGCESLQFDVRGFPVGQMKPGKETLDAVDVEGPVTWLQYIVNEGAGAMPTGLQIMRNFENAARKAAGTIEGQWPGWCKSTYDQEHMPRMGNGCTSYALTMKFVKGEKETWAFLQADEREGAYVLMISEREAMTQEVSVNEMADRLTKDGFLTLAVNFDTGKATITADSAKLLDDAAAALKAASTIQVEVGGHTDNVGAADANLALSQARAQAVMAALVDRDIAKARLTAKGYGQTVPIADNRTEDGRAKNRRVELVKR